MKTIKDPEGDRVVNDAGETVFQYDNTFQPIKLGAGLVVHYLRRDYAEKGIAAMLKFARELFPDPSQVTDGQLLAVAREEATFRGYSPPGVSYHDLPCATCRGRGSVPDPVAGGLDDCPTCEGDGFSPSVAEMPYRKDGLK